MEPVTKQEPVTKRELQELRENVRRTYWCYIDVLADNNWQTKHVEKRRDADLATIDRLIAEHPEAINTERNTDGE